MIAPLIRIENACWYSEIPTNKLDDIYIRHTDVYAIYTCPTEPVGCVILLDQKESIWTMESPKIIADKVWQGETFPMEPVDQLRLMACEYGPGAVDVVIDAIRREFGILTGYNTPSSPASPHP